MSDLGVHLKKARLEKGMSIETLEEVTKIRKRYLEAIEQGNYKVLPGNFYVRAFIKSYSEAVGLHPNEVLQMYQNVIPNPAPQSTAAAAEVMMRSRSTNKKTERGGKWASTFLMIAFVALIIGIVYYFVSVYSSPHNSVLPEEGNQITTRKDPGDAKPGTQTEPAPSPSAAPTPAPSASEPKKEEPIVPAPAPAPPAAAEVKQTDNVRETYTYSITNTNKLTIQMKVTGDSCWFQLDSLANGRKLIEQGTVKQGDPDKTWEVEGPAFLNVGKANAVQITVNGTPLNMGESPNPRRFQLNLQ